MNQDEKIAAKLSPQPLFRPLGLSLAIVGAAAFYGTMPLILYYLAYRLRPVEGEFLIYGGGLKFDIWSHLSALSAVAVLVSAIFAWRRHLPYIRYLFQFFILTSAILMAVAIVRLVTPSNDSNLNQLEQGLRNLFTCQAPIQIAMLVYVLWYFNRAPARAFYAGSPLTLSETRIQE